MNNTHGLIMARITDILNALENETDEDERDRAIHAIVINIEKLKLLLLREKSYDGH